MGEGPQIPEQAICLLGVDYSGGYGDIQTQPQELDMQPAKSNELPTVSRQCQVVIPTESGHQRSGGRNGVS